MSDDASYIPQSKKCNCSSSQRFLLYDQRMQIMLHVCQVSCVASVHEAENDYSIPGDEKIKPEITSHADNQRDSCFNNSFSSVGCFE